MMFILALVVYFVALCIAKALFDPKVIKENGKIMLSVLPLFIVAAGMTAYMAIYGISGAGPYWDAWITNPNDRAYTDKMGIFIIDDAVEEFFAMWVGIAFGWYDGLIGYVVENTEIGRQWWASFPMYEEAFFVTALVAYGVPVVTLTLLFVIAWFSKGNWSKMVIGVYAWMFIAIISASAGAALGFLTVAMFADGIKLLLIAFCIAIAVVFLNGFGRTRVAVGVRLPK
jgi:hypothetical protein